MCLLTRTAQRNDRSKISLERARPVAMASGGGHGARATTSCHTKHLILRCRWRVGDKLLTPTRHLHLCSCLGSDGVSRSAVKGPRVAPRNCATGAGSGDRHFRHGSRVFTCAQWQLNYTVECPTQRGHFGVDAAPCWDVMHMMSAAGRMRKLAARELLRSCHAATDAASMLSLRQ